MSNYRRRRKAPPKDPFKKFNVNKRVTGDQFRVIDGEGNMLGIMSREETMALAEEREADIVEVNPKADPKVVKLIDFNKFKYQVSKTMTKAKGDDTKTIRVSVRIAENDLKMRANKINKFLEQGKKVKLQVQMRGREKAHPEVARETMNTFLGAIGDTYSFVNEPSHAGDSFFATIQAKK
jgi:translation initiation factor IF-3